MNYTLEKIYHLVGKADQVATLTFKNGSEADKKYGNFLTVAFIYDQCEREEMDKLIQDELSSNHGRIKAKYLGIDLPQDKIEQLLVEGINSEDITDIYYINLGLKTNTFHSTEKRAIKKHIIQMEALPKGGDLGWMYGFIKRLVQDDVGLSPQDRHFYLAGKLFCEPENLNDQENQEINDKKGNINESVELELLQMKHMCEKINADEQQRLDELNRIKCNERTQKLDYYLKEVGSSLKKLKENNPHQATELLNKVIGLNERRLNVSGKHPIYTDLDSYLHIYLRHVEEFQVNKHFEHKDNFQWNEDDVFLVMENVIREIEDDYQKFREENPNLRYSKFGRQSIYFQGDYYTFHIETNGRISTFHKNRKEHEISKL